MIQITRALNQIKMALNQITMALNQNTMALKQVMMAMNQITMALHFLCFISRFDSKTLIDWLIFIFVNGIKKNHQNVTLG